MQTKTFLIGLLLIVIFGVLPVVSAQTMTEAQRQSLIAQLQAQIVQLQAQIAQILAQRQGDNPAWCYTFNNNLGYAQSGTTEVVNLHIALQKEGMSYSPDDISAYSTGTSEGVKQFQTKYNIKAPTPGYFGVLTRTKMNVLYGCKCTPSWQSGPWNVCENSLQTRTVTDLNNCGITTNKSAVEQSCTAKAIDISVDGSDGPIDMFVTLGNGAMVNTSGINLNKSVNLQWTGTSVSSCVASDTLTPIIFSGYKPSTSSQSVILSGTIKGTTSTDKITDTFKIDCISTITGAKVSDSIVVDLFYTASGNCSPVWNCTAWSTCASSKHTRMCTDFNGCGSLVNKPAVSETCTAVVCTPSWQPGTWGDCISGKQTRTVTDANNCGTTTGKLATSQTCCSAVCLDQTDGIFSLSCSGAITKCATGKTCELTHSTSYVNNNGTISPVETLTGSHCIVP